jgi:hypothetical protein
MRDRPPRLSAVMREEERVTPLELDDHEAVRCATCEVNSPSTRSIPKLLAKLLPT